MLASLQVIVPLFLLIGLGYLARRMVLTSEGLIGLNQLVYFFALPAMLFDAARRQPIDKLVDLPYIGAFLLAVALVVLVTVLGSRWLLGRRQGEELVLHGLNAMFANYAYMGIPLISGVIGEAAYGPMLAIILTGNLLICGGQVIMEALRSDSLGWRAISGILQRSLLQSPLFLSLVGGILVAAWQLPMPSLVAGTLELLAPAAVPVALFCLGASLQWRETPIAKLELGWLLLMKLLIHPLLTYGVMVIFGITDPDRLLVAVLLTALPTGALVHVVAMRYQHYVRETAMVVMVSTLLSMVSVSLWIDLMI
ncbi:AEC family transporter [Marinobacterium arenosum]|uniref:AEC family transporter n=1 Tax=Marinobacterium arenosum TaxID=2862496 RepID=UPI001C98D6B4|nr:AEC family transporter [Marinobacterium arenosum]MBY4677611.1 AEC family transporter [Marinobacterium arenosum]